MKAFIRHTQGHADRLRVCLEDLDADLRVALLHYAPTRDTLEGEPPEIYPFLGSYLLAEVIDAGGVAVAIHGHAHRGREHGTTDGGVPVRNVAEPVIGVPYRVYGVGGWQ
jgi:Icc-related predicted phosphoesterase